MTIEDLTPTPFNITIKGVEVECQPLRLSHALKITRMANVFENPAKASDADLERAETDMDKLVGDLIKDLKGVKLDVQTTIDLLGQLMTHIMPSENKELEELGVKVDSDPKAPKAGL